MGSVFRVFDFENGKIVSDIPSIECVCLVLRALSIYSSNLGVARHGSESFMTNEFSQNDGWFNHQPVKEKKGDSNE